MNRAVLQEISLRCKARSGVGQKVQRVFFGLFLAAFAWVWARLWWPGHPFSKSGWAEGLLLVLAAASLVASAMRQLPGQNVLLASGIIGVVASAIQELGVLAGIPSGPSASMSRIGHPSLASLSWAIPVVWIIAILSSRGVAQLTLRPWRNTPNYGLRVMGLTIGLAVWLDGALAPFSAQVKHSWQSGPARIGFGWYALPWVQIVGWLLTALLILVLATPALINKKPGPPPAPDYHPLIVWLLLNLLFATGCARARLWLAAALIPAGGVVAAFYAVRGAKMRCAGQEN